MRSLINPFDHAQKQMYLLLALIYTCYIINGGKWHTSKVGTESEISPHREHED